MKRMTWAALLLMVGFASPARAQMGTDLFKRPAFTKAFHPVVGKGAQYEMTNKTGSATKTQTMAMGIVGRESVDGKDGYWMQTVMHDSRGQGMVSKTLVTAGDFQAHRVIFQQTGQAAMEMTVNPSTMHSEKAGEAMEGWHSVGTETITVPAGTFTCEHWKNDKTGSEVWASDKVSPFGMVKETSKDNSMVLVKMLNDFSDQITGPVQKFDPQMMMQQMQQRRQPPNP